MTFVPLEAEERGKIDDKSGYNHVLLSRDSQQYFGIEWQGWWMVGVTLPIGWKNSPFV